MTELKVRVAGRDIRAKAEFVAGTLWLHVNGRTIAVEPESKFRGRRGESASNGDIAAPMPGKITKVFKSPGEPVVRGEPVVAMEAMKMEYTLKADVDGTVGEISCRVGDQVALGQTLAHLQPKEGP